MASSLDLSRDAQAIVERTILALRIEFGERFADADRWDLAQEGWARVFRAQRQGEVIRAPLAAVKTAARNVALDRLRYKAGRFEVHADGELAVLDEVDADADPEKALLTSVDLAGAIEAVEQLPSEQQVVYRATVIDGLSPAEARKKLGLGKTKFFELQKLAQEHVDSALLGDRYSAAERAKLRALSAYAAGIRDVRLRTRVERLVRTDPKAAAQLRALQRGHEAIASTLPVVVYGSTAGLLDRAITLASNARDAAVSLFARSSGQASELPATLSASGAGRGAGIAGAGIVAKLAAMGGAGQAAIACLAGGAAVTACVVTGVLPGLSSSSGDAKPNRERPDRHMERSVPPPKAASLLPSQVGHEAPPPPQPKPQKSADGGGVEKSAPEPTPEPAPAPEPPPDPVAETAPVQEQEFGVASAATPVTGAPPDTNDADGAAASTVRGEFGP